MASDPSYVAKGDPIMASGWNAMVGVLRENNLVSPRKPLRSRGGASAKDQCPFGELYTDTSGTQPVLKIRGGAVFCGDKNFTVPGHPVNENQPREVKVFLKIPFTVNVDDDDQFLLPGVKTSSTWEPKFEEIANTSEYPDNIPPELPTGAAQITVLIGLLKVKDGFATFFSHGTCGNKRIEHCGGNISYNSEITQVIEILPPPV